MIFTIAGKELKALFASPLAWVVLTFMQIVLGYSFLRRLDDFLQIQPRLIRMTSPPGVTEWVPHPPCHGRGGVVVRGAAPGDAADRRGARNQTMGILISSRYP
jgi:ABC-2 type transport system permease protein